MYNANGSRQAVVYADGTREDYTYDGASRVSTITHTDRNGTQLDYYEYTYDLVGNLTEEKNRYGSTSYTYDANRRLNSVTEPEGRITRYTYDTAGNRATKEVSYGEEDPVVTTYTYDSSNHLITETTGEEVVTYTYDGNGNLVLEEKTVPEELPEQEGALTGAVLSIPDITETDSETDTKKEYVTDYVIRYTYDGFNRMTGYETDDVYARYSYNAEDYRTGKNVTDATGIKNIQYFYDGSRVIMEADGEGNITSHNLYGTNRIGRSVQGEDYHYLYNAHGDVVMLLDVETGTIAGTYRYDAFGNVILQTGTPDNSITYAGYQYDEETGLYYLNARYYDSSTARFLTEDTFRGSYQDPLSLNRYTYCHNNPLIYWDPTGHAAKKYEQDYFYSFTTGELQPRCVIGSKGSYVSRMERMLEDAGYRPGDSNDGIFDGATLRAVRLFQQDNGLRVTGIVEQKAWAFLEIQPKLRNLESRYNRKLISEEEYLSQVYGLRKMAGNVPYMYEDRSLDNLKSEIYAAYNKVLSIELALLETQTIVMFGVAAEFVGDGADLLYDVYDAVVNKNPEAVSSIVYDSLCMFIPDGPLNYADNVVDNVSDVAKKVNKNVDNVTDATKKAGKSGSNTALTVYDPEFAARQLLMGGETSDDVLRSIIPKDTPNTFVPTSTIKEGYKYGFDVNGKKMEIKWHSQDLNAMIKYPNSNSGAGWTAQIKVGRKLLGQDRIFYKKPSNLTHIPMK